MMDLELEKYRVKNVAASAYYVAEWATAAEERALLAAVAAAPRPKWTQLSGRRVQNWGGVPTARGMVAERLPGWLRAALARLPPGAPPRPNHVLVNEYLPGQGILPHEDGPLFHPAVATLSLGSHAVLRLSRRAPAPAPAGQEAAPGPAPAPAGQEAAPGPAPAPAGQEAAPGPALLLEPRSLLVLRDELYTHHLHSIQELHCDLIDDSISNLDLCSGRYEKGSTLVRDTRISLTIRHVPKTSSFKLGIGS